MTKQFSFFRFKCHLPHHSLKSELCWLSKILNHTPPFFTNLQQLIQPHQFREEQQQQQQQRRQRVPLVTNATFDRCNVYAPNCAYGRAPKVFKVAGVFFKMTLDEMSGGFFKGQIVSCSWLHTQYTIITVYIYIYIFFFYLICIS